MIANHERTQTLSADREVDDPAERLRLASLILNDLAPATETVDESGEWSDLDLAQATQSSHQHFVHQAGG